VTGVRWWVWVLCGYALLVATDPVNALAVHVLLLAWFGVPLMMLTALVLLIRVLWKHLKR